MKKLIEVLYFLSLIVMALLFIYITLDYFYNIRSNVPYEWEF